MNEKLPSQFQINDGVEYKRDPFSVGISYGKIVAIKFTESKVFYDIYDHRTAELVEKVPSSQLIIPTDKKEK